MLVDQSGKIVGHISLGGPTREIAVQGKVVTFEDHPYCGPTPVHKKTGDVLKGEPSKAYWDAIERWIIGGKQLGADGVRAVVPAWCVACRGTGSVDDPEREPTRRNRFVVTCPQCGGKKIQDVVAR